MHRRPIIIHNILCAASHLHSFDIIIFFIWKCAVSQRLMLIALCLVFVVNLPFYAEIVSSYARNIQYGFIAYRIRFQTRNFFLSYILYTMAITGRRCAYFLFQLCTTYAICSFNLFNEHFREYWVDILFWNLKCPRVWENPLTEKKIMRQQSTEITSILLHYNYSAEMKRREKISDFFSNIIQN